MIKPEFWDDEKLGMNTSIQARLIFIGLWNHSDDYGVVKGNSRWLKNHILPYEDSVSPHAFEKWLTELQNIKCILPFDARGEKYFLIRNFDKHQSINRPSKQRNPEPPNDIFNVSHEGSVSNHGGLTDETETETETETEYNAQKTALDRFQDFWLLYDKKKDKKKCESKWGKLKKSDKDKIFDTLPFYISTTPDPKFRKHPYTYLNGECWNDELTTNQTREDKWKNLEL